MDRRSLEVSKGLHLAYSPPTSTNEQSSEQMQVYMYWWKCVESYVRAHV